MKSFDKEFRKCVVTLYDWISAEGSHHRKFKTKEFDSEEKAVQYGKEMLAEGFRVKIETVCDLVGWEENE